MKIEDIIISWKQDSEINDDDLGNAAISTSKLHSKYIEFLVKEKIKYRLLESEYNKHKNIKWKYYKGYLDISELKELNLKQFPYNLTNKADIDIFLNSDDTLDKLQTKMYYSEQKIYLLEQILKQIYNRGYNIKNKIDWVKFQNGF